MKVLVSDKLAEEAIAVLKGEHEVVEAEPWRASGCPGTGGWPVGWSPTTGPSS